MKRIVFTSMGAVAAIAAASPLAAQDYGESEGRDESRSIGAGAGRATVEPYIEVSQIAVAELSPGNDVVTYTQLAAGVDATVTGRNTGGSVSLRYEKNIGYGDNALDSDTLSGVARGYASIVPRTLTVEAGALAARTRVDSNGGATLNPLIGEESESNIYSVYAGPNLHTSAGDVEINANYRAGYTKVEQPDSLVVTPGADPVDVFDDSLSQSAGIHLATRPGEPLPVGLGVGAGWNQEDVSNLDQRVRDMYVRGDVTVPVGQSLAVVAGVGYEDVEVSSRDAVRDVNGDPVIGDDGRLVTDKSQPRIIAYETSGMIWDAGVIWRPSTRTAFEAHVGRRYDSTTYYGSFAWAPDSRSAVNVSVYDTVSGFGNQLNTALANLPAEFTANRNALTGDLFGCVAGAEADEGSSCLNGVFSSVRGSVFRSRGVAANYSTTVGRLSTGLGFGYDRRKFIAAPGTVLAAANGVIDESYYAAWYLSGSIDARSAFSTNAYATLVESGFDSGGDVMAVGASASYSRSLTPRLSARAAIALDHIDSDISIEDITTASALVGLRLGF
ncbi:preprotein translocase subunit YajC [Altererythrobacter luteolus]|uniref:Preprotein translocase subunit YajC n=1 Tax=Pontixanthobacter luteolus TaxID=295089 RepID=A0A6I4UZV5_9SPHN|nr:preprotein translocase subunit YajC [Pontixanthobacter luteolus]MXP46501.1 preprotein translocase subunit YajC [Pontixanthobacter luteolus]